MSRLTLMIVQVEGDAAAISAALDNVQRELARAICPSEPSNGAVELVKAAPAVKRAVRVAATKKSSDEEKEDRAPAEDSFRDRALTIIRDSHQGVTSEELYKALGCTSIGSAYQICRYWEARGKVQRTPDKAWKAIKE